MAEWLCRTLVAVCFATLVAASNPPTPPANPSRDVSIGIVDVSLNSAFKVYAVQGAMDWQGPIENTTTSILRNLLPCAFSACPGCPLDANMVVLQAPSVTLRAASGASVTAPNGLVAISTNGTQVAKVSLAGMANLSLSLAPGSAFVKIKVKVVSITCSVESVCGGDPVSPKLEAALETLIANIVTRSLVPFLNSDRFPGIPIPVVEGFVLESPSVAVQDGIIVVGSDIEKKARHHHQYPIIETAMRRLHDPVGLAFPLVPTSAQPFVTDGDFKINSSVSAINKVLQSELPDLEQKVNQLSIPESSGKSSGVSWSTSATTIQNFGIGKATISMVEGIGISISLTGLKMELPRTSFRVSKRIIIKLSCSGHFSGSLDDTSVTVKLAVGRNAAGAPVVTPTSKWTWGALDVSAKLDNIVCKVVKDIVQLFEGDVDDKIRDAIKTAVPPKLDAVILAKANNALAQLTKPINVDSYASIAMALAKDPVFSSSDVELSLLGVWGPPEKISGAAPPDIAT